MADDFRSTKGSAAPALPEFGPDAVFGDWNGTPASLEPAGFVARTWPDGRFIPFTSFDEDVEPISRDEFMRRVAAAQAAP